MCYLNKIEYEIVLNDSLSVIRGCAKCGTKTRFINTKKFRVNANGNKLDVWLIYQCENCKHTLNLTIYERQKVSAISKEEYQSFLCNDEQLAEMYGKSMQFFRKNKADIDFERLDYDFVKLHETSKNCGPEEQIEVTIHNPYQLNIRPEKQIAAVLGLSGSQVKKLMEQGKIKPEKSLSQIISFSVSTSLFHMEE
ncbi:MAG: DUF1062 domain-containing protein [Lachnospiraceae bacterium]|nr:DUF1062 domain-containing protein [Lachnospiraceae bacterium]